MGFREQTLTWRRVSSATSNDSETTDTLTVRTTRSRIIYLKNDYKELMNVIEKHIHEHFAKQAENARNNEPPTNGAPSTLDVDSRPAPQVLTPPFAKVNSVVAGSPAETAGLSAGDLIRNFGYVNNTNHDGLKRVGECVQGNEGVSQKKVYPSNHCIDDVAARCVSKGVKTRGWIGTAT